MKMMITNDCFYGIKNDNDDDDDNVDNDEYYSGWGGRRSEPVLLNSLGRSGWASACVLPTICQVKNLLKFSTISGLNLFNFTTVWVGKTIFHTCFLFLGWKLSSFSSLVYFTRCDGHCIPHDWVDDGSYLNWCRKQSHHPNHTKSSVAKLTRSQDDKQTNKQRQLHFLQAGQIAWTGPTRPTSQLTARWETAIYIISGWSKKGGRR